MNEKLSPFVYAGITVDAFLFAGLWLLWQASRWYNRVLRKLGTRERLRVTWLLGKGQPEITVVAAAPAQQHSPTLLSPPRQQEGVSGELDDADGLDAASASHSPHAAFGEGVQGSGRFSVLKALSPKRYMKALSPKRAPPQVGSARRSWACVEQRSLRCTERPVPLPTCVAVRNGAAHRPSFT